MKRAEFNPFSKGMLIFDGGMATEIYRNHIFTNRCFDELNLSMPQLIHRIHQSYVNAGAEVLITNTFGANRPGLEKYGLADKVTEINRSGADIARSAAAPIDQNTHESVALVAGSVGPILDEGVGRSLDESAEILAEQVAALREGGSDFILFETLRTPEQVAAAVAAAALAGSVPYMLSFAPPESDEELEEELGRLFARAEEASISPFAVGLNCGRDPAEMLAAVETAMKLTRFPLVVRPNAGYPKPFEGRLIYYCSPEYIATYAMEYLDYGVSGIGGCCGTTADHIAEIVKMVKPLVKSRQRYAAEAPVTETPFPVREESPFAGRTCLAAKIASGDWIRTVELTPPSGYDLTQTLAKTKSLAEFGIDAINLPDGPRASSRIANIAVAQQIIEKVGIEPILHFCCRDRNLIGMQSELLACALYKIRNILFITGDPPKLGNYPNATGVFDTDAIGLCELQTRLNRGVDLGAGSIEPATDAVIGVGLDPTALNRSREIERFRLKIEAGAHFAITQPVFDPDALLRFLDEIGDLPIAIIAGVWPLTSYRNAVFMGREVPGVVIPDEIMHRMEAASAGSKEDQVKTGIEIARVAVERIRDRVAGIQVSAPFGRVEISMEVMAE
ncbi:MAG: bifunctional homocysteine S-methyltransferase/methylenetetrahydrofolate reductase [Thermoguttaceae bacterium]|jgi:methionine synthase I (cobalamin-dependent)/5,10-methylenetetrahydrofolate reductase